MTPELEALARRAVACPRWRWMPGMVDTLGNRANEDGWPSYSTIDYGATDVVEVVTWKVRPPRSAIPDLADPATLGCLLALVREAWNEPILSAAWGGGHWYVVQRVHPSVDALRWIDAATEVEALVAALEAAP